MKSTKAGVNLNRDGFFSYLVSAGLTAKASGTRATWCRRVEEICNVDLDNIVKDKEQTLDLIETVMSHPNMTDYIQNHYPNAIRHYYSFRNGEKLGTLRDNNRR